MSYLKYNPAAIMRMDIPEPEWLVENLIVMGSATVFPAREKAGKGLLAVDLGCSVALGEPWLGSPVLEGPVIYLALEESLRTIRERLRVRLQGRFDVPFFVILADGTLDQSFQLENVQDVAGITEVIAEVEPVLFIVDPLREAHSGREDSSDDMAPRLRAIRQLAHQTGTTFLVSHHASKASGNSRGSSSIKASFDDELSFVRSDEANEADIRGVLKAEGRNLRKTSLGIIFDSKTGRWNATNETDLIADPGLRGRILALLEDSGEWLSANNIAARLPGVALKTIQNKMSDLCREQPCPIVADGQPRRGHPRHFRTLQQRIDIVPDGSGNDVGNDRGIA